MTIFWIIVIIVVVYQITYHNFFCWKSIVIKLWKNIFKQANYIIEMDNTINTDELEKSIKIQGELINAILKYLNYFKRKGENKNDNDDDYEEETFKYGYFDFEHILRGIRIQKTEEKKK